jgi:hypothetical protein
MIELYAALREAMRRQTQLSTLAAEKMREHYRTLFKPAGGKDQA